MTQELEELVHDLPEGSTVGTIDSSYATIGDDHIDESNCRKLLDSVDTVTQMVEALGGLDETEKMCVELVGLEVDDDVLTALETNFKSLDDV